MTDQVDVAVKSVQHGKMVRACVVRERAGTPEVRATTVTFTGDFFLEPAEVLDDLNEAMRGATAADAAERATAFFAVDRAMLLIGAGAEDFAAAVLKALEVETASE